MSTLADIESYLHAKNVNGLLKNVLENICLAKPDNPVQFIVDFLYRTYPSQLGPRGSTQPAADTGKTLSFDIEDDKDTDEEEIEEMADDAGPPPEVLNRRGSNRRCAVSAEPMNEDEEEPAPIGEVKAKSPEEIAKIERSVGNNILFAHLDSEQKEELFNRMVPFSFKENDTIIKQGDDGDYFYVIEEGACDIYVTKDDEEPGPGTKPVKSCAAGDTFGELALMYGTPRAATVKARTDVQTWAIDRANYRRILMDTAQSKRKLYERFLENVPILDSLTRYERLTLADALEPVDAEEGTKIVCQGDRGDHFFIVEKGECTVTQSAGEGSEEITLANLSEGDYFGEIALLTNKPRAATVTAASKVRCVRVDRKAFTRLLGPCESILRRNMSNYNSYMATKI